MSGPADKWAYTPIELGAIWHIGVDLPTVGLNRYRRARYFSKIGEQQLADILLRAALAEYDVPTVEQMIDKGELDCPVCRQVNHPCSRHT